MKDIRDHFFWTGNSKEITLSVFYFDKHEEMKTWHKETQNSSQLYTMFFCLSTAVHLRLILHSFFLCNSIQPLLKQEVKPDMFVPLKLWHVNRPKLQSCAKIAILHKPHTKKISNLERNTQSPTFVLEFLEEFRRILDVCSTLSGMLVE